MYGALSKVKRPSIVDEAVYNLKTRSTQRAQTSADPEDPDFGLWTPGSEA